MSHTIKLEDRVYHQLEQFRGKRETFSQAVERLLGAKEKANELSDILSAPRNSKEVNHGSNNL